VAVLAQGRLARGLHAATWRPDRSRGTHWWRFRTGGVDLVRPTTA